MTPNFTSYLLLSCFFYTKFYYKNRYRNTEKLHSGGLDFALAHLRTEEAKVSIKQRKTYAEIIFAEAKNSHGLRKATCRGLEKVRLKRIQALLTCAVQNMKRLIKHYQTSVANSIFLVLRKLYYRERILVAPLNWITNSMS